MDADSSSGATKVPIRETESQSRPDFMPHCRKIVRS